MKAKFEISADVADGITVEVLKDQLDSLRVSVSRAETDKEDFWYHPDDLPHWLDTISALEKVIVFFGGSIDESQV